MGGPKKTQEKTRKGKSSGWDTQLRSHKHMGQKSQGVCVWIWKKALAAKSCKVQFEKQ